MQTSYKRNRLTFGLGTFGRDMVYSLVSMYLIFYLTDVIKLTVSTLWWVTGITLAARIFDALNDPIMGCIVDNTRTRWGKFKPWIVIGMPISAIVTVLLFTDFGLTNTTFKLTEGGFYTLVNKEGAYIITFAVFYLLWGISYTIHDISYWSMLPSLSIDQKEREKIGAIARICANIGLFLVVAGIVPLTKLLGDRFDSLQKGYFVFAMIVSLIMAAGMCITLFGVKEAALINDRKQGTPLKELLRIIIKNDQLFFTAIAMSLFMIGYTTTASFGLYFFKYAYGDEGMYPIFAMVLGVSQITALAIFPLFSKRFDRKTLFTGAIILISAGYIIFFFAPVTTMKYIGIGGTLIFIGQSFVQLLMLMFLADSVDYGHWKLGKRNDSITFSLQPLINKMGGAIAGGIVSAIIIVSGIKEANTAEEVTKGGLLMMKLAMLIFPLVCIAASYFICRFKYKIDSRFYEQILSDLRARGELKSDAGNNEQ